jgi:phosphoribosylformimino-5-aminoimidazole carboxamide ribotide isomerase
MFPEFEVVPAVDMQDGEVVQLVQGERGTETRYGDPVAAARRWVDAGAVASIVEAVDIPVQLGGGIRTAADARALLDGGVDRVILGTAALNDPDIVADISETHPGSVVVSLDAKGGEVVVEGWTEGTGIRPADAAGRYADRGAAAILFTNVDVEGRLGGVDTDAVARVVDAVGIPVVASGGVATLDDVRALREAGAAAIVVGTALYEGRFSLAEAMAA